MYVDIKDTKIYYNILDGNKEFVVLFVHGFATHSGAYMDLLNHINSFGYKVYLLDLCGHGLSGGERGNANVENNIKTVMTFRTEIVKEKNVVLIGHSMGGLTAGRVLQEDDFTYKGAILLSPMVRSGSYILKTSKFDLTILPEWSLKIIDKILHTIAGPMVVQAPVDFTTITETTTELFIQGALRDTLVPHVVPLKYVMKLFKEAKVFINKVDDIDVPVHIIYGDKDQLTSPNIEFLIKDKPNISYSLVTGAGHEPHHEIPEISRVYFDEVLNAIDKMF